MNGNPDLDREELTSLFDDLSRELEFARTRVQIYVIGGAAMSMAFNREDAASETLARHPPEPQQARFPAASQQTGDPVPQLRQRKSLARRAAARSLRATRRPAAMAPV